MIRIVQKGSFDKTEKFLNTMSRFQIASILNEAGRAGVHALSQATPIATGATSDHWSFTITNKSGQQTIAFYNDNHDKSGTPIAILLQYGHGTRNGGYVQGRDFINPAIQPIFDQIANNAWKAVTSA